MLFGIVHWAKARIVSLHACPRRERRGYKNIILLIILPFVEEATTMF
jgi:hypothetical protein